MPHRDIRPEVLDVLPMAVVRHLGRQSPPVQRRILLANVAGVLVVLLYGLWAGDFGQSLVAAAYLLVCGYCYWEFRQKRPRKAFAAFCWGMLALAGVASIFVAGIRTPMLVSVPPLIMLAAWAIGRPTALRMLGMSLVFMLLLVLAELAGWLPAPQPRTAVQVLLAYVQVSIMVAALAMTMTTNMSALLSTSTELAELMTKRLQRLRADKQALQGTAQHLEAQVQERTAELQRTVAHLEQALDLTRSGVWTVDLGQSRKSIEASPPTQQILGLPPRPGHRYSHKEWVRSIQSVADVRALQMGRENTAAIVKGETEQYALEYPFLRPSDNTVVWARQVVSLQRNAAGQPERLVAVLTDITQPHQNEAALNASNLLSNAALNMVQAGSWSCDFINQPYVTLLSPEAAAIVGYPARTSYCMPDSEWIRAVAAADVQVLVTHGEMMRRMKRGEISEYDLIYQRIRRSDGSRRWNRVVAHAVRDCDGNLTGLIGVIMDVTDATISELALRQTKSAAESAARAKSDFLANMSHEIRTPLNAITGLSELALRMEMPAPLQDYLTKIRRSSQHLLSVVDNILDFTKIENNRLEVESIAFLLSSVLEKAVAMTSNRAKEKGLELSCSVEPGLPALLLGDPLRIGQVLINLASNAVKFTSQGMIHIAVVHRGNVDGRVALRFTVSDQGIGLSDAQKSRLFQSFAQGDASITRQYGGSGLGLAISKGLVERMGGHIGVESSPGQGSTFWFELTLDVARDQDAHTVLATQTTSALAMAPGLAKLGGARLLVVEDNEINQQVVAEVLRNAGFRVDVADDGQMGVNQVQSHFDSGTPYDLVLMDMQMPILDGLSATRLIRQTHSAQRLPIVALTANAQPRDRQRCLEAGMNDFIAKPINQAELWRTLLQWVVVAPHMSPQEIALPARNAQADQALNALRGIAELDVRLGLVRTGGDAEFYLAMLGKFVHEQRDCMVRMRSALAAGDSELAQRLVHSLKGASGNLGASALQESVANLEKGLREQVPAHRLRVMERHTQGLLHALVEALQAHLPALPESLPKPSPPSLPSAQEQAQSQAVLAQLRDLLEQADSQATEIWESHALLLTKVLPQGREVGAAVVEYDFARALALLDKSG